MKSNDGKGLERRKSGECIRRIRARGKSGLSNRIRKWWSIVAYIPRRRAQAVKKGMKKSKEVYACEMC